MRHRMLAACSKPLILVVISLLIVALVYSSFPKSYMAFASQSPPGGPIGCEVVQDNPAFIECCQTSKRGPGDIEIHWCTMCDNTDPPSNCGERYPEEVALTPPTPSPKGPLGTILPGGEVLQELEQNPPSPSPEETAPTIDCAQNPDDPLCETATIPESENESQTQGRIIGESPSPTGYCAPIRTPTCIPCDPGLPGSTCVPESDWPPTRTTDAGSPEGEESSTPIPPPAGPLSEQAPQVAPPMEGDGSAQPPTEPLCPEGQVLDEETNLCVVEQPEATEEPTSEEEQQPSEESDSGEDGNN